ncbi:hypothetical protein JTE90_007728 [Oedothorax gibbosus]|uniref:Uncharacterized protein n=1 Tax=Oedothorax gibbosus TaxID=931172 RepID=A0AAV6V622_9ARAC|nr:hypothetical protein JTE90_007728 [Oedothorax gibbosus]
MQEQALASRATKKIKAKTKDGRGGWKNHFCLIPLSGGGTRETDRFMFRADDVNAMTRQNYLRAASVEEKRTASSGCQQRGPIPWSTNICCFASPAMAFSTQKRGTAAIRRSLCDETKICFTQHVGEACLTFAFTRQFHACGKKCQELWFEQKRFRYSCELCCSPIYNHTTRV